MTDMDKEMVKLQTIQKMVERYLYSNVYDVEDIAMKIYIELLEKDKYLSRLYVRNRCIDESRRARKITFCPLEHFEHLESQDETNSTLNSIELVNLLIANVIFSPTERLLIYRAFYKGEKVSPKELDPIIIKLRRELNLLLAAKGDVE